MIANYLPIDMTYPKLVDDDKNIVKRFCASIKTIPNEAFNIACITKVNVTNNYNCINPRTSKPFGYSYNIAKKYGKLYRKAHVSVK